MRGKMSQLLVTGSNDAAVMVWRLQMSDASVKMKYSITRYYWTAVAAEAVKKWDGGQSLMGGVWEGLPSFGGPGVLHLGNFFENIGANVCNLMHFGDIRSSKVGCRPYVLCFHEISSICWWIFCKTFVIGASWEKTNWLGSGQKVKVKVTAWPNAILDYHICLPICLCEISSSRWWIVTTFLSLVHLGTKMNWLHFGWKVKVTCIISALEVIF